jgi:hypothetical protein
VRPDLLQGRLVEVMPQWVPRRELVHALFPSRRGLLPAVRSLLDFLADQFAALCRVEQAHEHDAEAAVARASLQAEAGCVTLGVVDSDHGAKIRP